LLSASLHSLVDHSRVENANDPETLAAEAEAARVAARAAEALRRSRAQVAQVRLCRVWAHGPDP
jgi:DNA excision repair protein ERCC-6